MGLLSNLIGAGVKTVLTPIAVVKDAVKVTVGMEADSTKELVEDIAKDVKKAADDLCDGNL